MLRDHITPVATVERRRPPEPNQVERHEVASSRRSQP
jgi:hypothetical protein